MISLTTPIAEAPKVSKRIVPALRRLGIATVRDLLFHFPSRYEDFSHVVAVADIRVGETVTIQGAIQNISAIRTRQKHMALTEATVGDGTGTMTAVWFNQPFLSRTLAPVIALPSRAK